MEGISEGIGLVLGIEEGIGLALGIDDDIALGIKDNDIVLTALSFGIVDGIVVRIDEGIIVCVDEGIRTAKRKEHAKMTTQRSEMP